MTRSFTAQGIVLSRANTGETDRIVTLLTREHGKLVCVAKGVRKLKSSKGGALEPGNLVKAFFIQTKSLPILTQVLLVDDYRQLPQLTNQNSLTQLRKLSQMLEIFQRLFVEEEMSDQVFKQVMSLRQLCTQEKSAGQMKTKLGTLIESLGFQHPKETDFENISDYLEDLLARPLHSYKYLRV